MQTPSTTTQVLEWPDGAWIVAEWVPPEQHPLHGWVERIWHATGTGGGQGYRVLPHGMSELTWTRSGRFRFAAGSTLGEVMPGSWHLQSGARCVPTDVHRLAGHFEVVGVRLHPAMIPRCGVALPVEPAMAVTRVSPPGGFAPDQPRWGQRPDWMSGGAEMVERFQAWLQEALRAGSGWDDVLDQRILDTSRMLIAARGQLRIAMLADLAGVPRSRYRTRFLQIHGVTPKVYARVHRFRTAVEWMQPGRALTTVAAACGYADQAHFSREFRGFGGLSPGAFRRIRTRYRDSSFRLMAEAPRRHVPAPKLE